MGDRDHRRGGEDVAYLADVLFRWWAGREVHERRDGVDVDAVLNRLDGSLAQARSVTDYARRLREGLWSLNDGHLRAGTSPELAETLWVSGMAFAQADDGLVIMGGPSGKPGDVVVAVDGDDPAAFLNSVRLRPGSTNVQRERVAVDSLSWQLRYSGEKPRPTRIVLAGEDGSRRHVELSWVVSDASHSTPSCVTARRVSAEIGLMRVGTFACHDAVGQVSDAEFERQLAAATAVLSGVPDVIVDLRDNGGGRDQQARSLARAFLDADESIEWMRYQGRDHAEPWVERLVAGPEPGPLSGVRPCLLVGPGCTSTAEILVAALRNRGATVIGWATAGSVGNPIGFRLPASAIAVDVPVTRYFAPGTTDLIEGYGLRPDIQVKSNITDFRRKMDSTLEVALELIRG